MICEKIADGDCPFLGCWKSVGVLRGNESQLSQSKPLPRVQMMRKESAQPIQHLSFPTGRGEGPVIGCQASYEPAIRLSTRILETAELVKHFLTNWTRYWIWSRGRLWRGWWLRPRHRIWEASVAVAASGVFLMSFHLLLFPSHLLLKTKGRAGARFITQKLSAMNPIKLPILCFCASLNGWW